MNYTHKLLVVWMALLICAACTSKEGKSDNLISGSTSKTWKEVREITAEGAKENLTKDEKSELIEFFSDGKFIIRSENSTNAGKWAYDTTGQSLSLTFEGANFTEYFKVIELEKTKMKLKGRDGAILVMKEEKG